MQIVLDTNVLVRFFTNDIPAKATKVAKLLEKEKDIFIPDVVFPELEYILIKKYESPRDKVVETYKFLISKTNIRVFPSVKKAVELFEVTNLDMADCIIATEVRGGAIASFDKELIKKGKVKPFWK